MRLPVVLAVLIGVTVLACSTVTPAPAEPTPNIDATVEARFAQERAVDATVEARAKELAAEQPTATPYPTYTPNPTYTPYPTPTNTPTLVPTATSVPTPTDAPTPIPTPAPTNTPGPTSAPTPIPPTPTPVPLLEAFSSNIKVVNTFQHLITNKTVVISFVWELENHSSQPVTIVNGVITSADGDLVAETTGANIGEIISPLGKFSKAPFDCTECSFTQYSEEEFKQFKVEWVLDTESEGQIVLTFSGEGPSLTTPTLESLLESFSSSIVPAVTIGTMVHQIRWTIENNSHQTILLQTPLLLTEDSGIVDQAEGYSVGPGERFLRMKDLRIPLTVEEVHKLRTLWLVDIGSDRNIICEFTKVLGTICSG